MGVPADTACVVLAGSGELADAVAEHLRKPNLMVRLEAPERALGQVWMLAPELVVAMEDAVVDGGASFCRGMLSEAVSAEIPLLLVRRGRGDRRLSHVATIAPSLGAKRLGNLIELLLSELTCGTPIGGPLQDRISALLRQVEQEEAFRLCRQAKSAPRLSAPVANHFSTHVDWRDDHERHSDALVDDSCDAGDVELLAFDEIGHPCDAEEVTLNRIWMSEQVAANDESLVQGNRQTMPAPPPDRVAIARVESASHEADDRFAELGSRQSASRKPAADVSGMHALKPPTPGTANCRPSGTAPRGTTPPAKKVREPSR